MMNWLLDHIWPFSEIRRLREACDRHFEFGDACLSYLNIVHKPWKHIRMNGKLYIMDADTTSVIERGDANEIFFRTHDGIEEVVAKPGCNMEYEP